MSHKALHLSRDQAESLRVASEMLRRLRAVERAHALGDEEALVAMLAGVDPVETALTENALNALYLVWRSLPDIPNRGGLDVAAGTDGPQALLPPAAPVIPLDTYSKRVPCA